MADWMELTFCHFNDMRSLVEAWTRDPGIIHTKMGRRGETILHRAALRRRKEMVEFLLQHGARQESDSNGNLPLHCSSLGGDPCLTSLLLAAGADSEAPNTEGDRPLHLAAGAGNVGVLRVLLEAGASLESRGRGGNSALHSAAEEAQVEVMEELLARGHLLEVTNCRGEYPVHLAAGAQASHGDIRHVEILLQHGANLKKCRTEEGSTAAHYAARTGPVEVLRLLLDASCPLTKAKLDHEFRWHPVTLDSSVLECVASSCCERKATLMLDRLMAARCKLWETRASLSRPWGGGRPTTLRAYRELSSQELELCMMYRQLENSRDLLKVFLHNCPASVGNLLDRCIVEEEDSSVVNFDFFLFGRHSSGDSELAVIDLVIGTGRSKLLEHPLFEIFIQLKWLKLWRIYTGIFLFLLLHLLAITLFSLARYSSGVADNLGEEGRQASFYILLTTNTLLLLLQVAEVLCLPQLPCLQQPPSQLSSWARRRETLYPLLDLLTPALGFLLLAWSSRELAGLLVLYCSWQLMRSLTVFPRLGKNMFITSQVTRTILEFLLSYMVELLAFTLTFHLLMPNAKIFSNMGDSFIKVITMLLGEFEFEDLNEGRDISWMTKIVFLLFVMLMSVVLINLVIGLSISDVGNLRKDAHIHKLINTVSAIKSVERLLGRLAGWRKAGGQGSTGDQVWLQMSHLDYCTSNHLHVVREVGEKEELVACPSTVLREVARILIDRREAVLCQPACSKARRQLLDTVAHHQEEFFENTIKALIKM